MAKTRAQKEETLKLLQDKFGRAKSVVFADYRGLTMKQLSELRDKLRDQQAEFTITKNTLLARALSIPEHSENSVNQNISVSDHQTNRKSDFSEILSNSEFSETFTGPTATLFAYDDEISPIKLLVKTLKDAGIGKVKSGLLGTEALDEFKVNQLAELPTKDELRSKTVGVLVTPLQGMVGVLQANLRNLVYALNQIKENRSASA